MSLAPGAFSAIVGSLTDPEFIRVKIRGRTSDGAAATKPHLNFIDFRRDGLPFPGGTLANFIADLAGTIKTEYLDCMTANYVLNDIEATYLDNPLSIPVSVGYAEVGTATGDRTPSFDAVTTRKVTNVPGRNYRGSMHMGAVPEPFTLLDKLTTAGITAYDALMVQLNLLVTGGVTDGAQIWYPVVISSTLSNFVVSPRVFTGATITQFLYNVTVGSMLRRKVRQTS